MIAALIQSRLDSKRLPGKALFELGDKKIIEHCIDAVKNSKFYTPILVTTDRNVDNQLVEVAVNNNILYFRGSLNNVAKRALDCIDFYNVSYFSRVNGDSPFTQYSLLDFAFKRILKDEYDFISNIFKRTYPYGISVELLNADIYRKHYPYFQSNPIYQEHYTKYFYDNKNEFNYYSIESKENNAAYNLAIDTLDDYQKAQKLLYKYPDLINHTLQNLLEQLKSK